MKRTKIYIRNLMLLSIFIASNSFAQKTDFSNDYAYKFTSYEISKGLIINTEGATLIENENVNERVLSSFNAKFKNAEEVSWKQVKNDFLAKFKKDEISTETLFNKNGKIIYSVEYGYEKKLPAEVKNIVTENYGDYILTCASKVTRDNRKIWFVILAGKHNDIRAKIEDGDIEEMEVISKP